MNIGQVFKILSQRAKQVLAPSPNISVKLNGFEMSLEKKQGVLLTYKAEEGEKPKPASQDSYYELTVRSTGTNSEYTQDIKPRKLVFTIGLDKGFGMTNGVHYLPVGSRFTGFEVVEKYDDGKIKPNEIFMGKLMPPHHTATIKAFYRDLTGRKQSMDLGIAVRRSERESSEWRMAASCPITYI